VFLFGGGIALGLGLEASGFAYWVAGGFSSFLGSGATAWTIFAVAALLGFALSYAASNTAAALIATPIAGTLALGAGVSPIGPIIGAALACSIGSAIPSTTPPMAIVYSSGFVKIWDMIKVGVVSDLIRLGVLILIGPFLVGLIS
jgi:sodium-dependent dicarboxylate transporter 2/3/5